MGVTKDNKTQNSIIRIRKKSIKSKGVNTLKFCGSIQLKKMP